MRNFQASSDEFAERCVSTSQKGKRVVGVYGRGVVVVMVDGGSGDPY